MALSLSSMLGGTDAGQRYSEKERQPVGCLVALPQGKDLLWT